MIVFEFQAKRIIWQTRTMLMLGKTMRYLKHYCLIAFSLACLQGAARAADDFGFGGGGEVKASFSNMQNRERDRYDRALDVSASIPLFETKSGGSLVKYSVSAAYGSKEEQVPVIPRALELYDGRVSAGAVILNSKTREMYMLRLGASIAEEKDTLSDPQERLSFFGMGTHHAKPNLTYLYGLGYSYVFGRGLLFPAFGVNWKIDERQDINFILPLQARYGYIVNPAIKVSLYSAAFGNQFRFKNQGLYPGNSDVLYLHSSGVKLGVGAEYKVFTAWTLGADIATVLRRDDSISSDSQNDLAQDKTAHDYIFQAFCKYSFDSRHQHREESK